MIDWFGSDELRHVVGGDRWWQVRGLDGVEAEWITEKEFLSPPVDKRQNRQQSLTSVEEDILRMDHLETVMVSAIRRACSCLTQLN
jgi:hypothetical protein